MPDQVRHDEDAIPNHRALQAMPTDLHFYLFAIPAVLLIGLAKGGFTGLGALGTPLMAVGMRDPVRAAAILLPILIVQDIVGVAPFRRTWSGSILAIMLPGAIVGIGLGYLLAATISEAAIMAVLGGISILFGAYRLLGGRDLGIEQFAGMGRDIVRHGRRLHQPDRACGRTAIPDVGHAEEAGARYV